MPIVLPIALAALITAATLGAAQADEWLMGDPMRWSLDGSDDDADLSLNFTPRVGPLSLDGVRLNLSLGGDMSAAETSRHRALANVDDRSTSLGVDDFVVGGALALEGMELSAQIAQQSHMAGQSETVRAALKAGGVTTALSYTDGIDGTSRERFALGTAVEAAPGVSFGADLSLDDAAASGGDRDASGVLRFRLEF